MLDHENRVSMRLHAWQSCLCGAKSQQTAVPSEGKRSQDAERDVSPARHHHSSKLMLDFHSRARESQPSGTSRDRVDAGQIRVITKSACCHVIISGAARFGHPPERWDAVCKRGASVADIPEFLGLAMWVAGRWGGEQARPAAVQESCSRRSGQDGRKRTVHTCEREVGK